MVQHFEPFAFGRAEVFGDGKDVALLVHGFLLAQAVAAAELLREFGIAARVINVRTPVPIDRATILAAAHECELLVTIEDHFVTGGLYSILAELFLAERVACCRSPWSTDGSGRGCCTTFSHSKDSLPPRSGTGSLLHSRIPTTHTR